MTARKGRWRPRWKLLGAGALVGLGLDAATFSSLPLLLLSILLIAAGVGWLLHTIWTDRDAGALHRRRREVLLATGTASITIAVIVAVALVIRIGPRHLALENQRYDAELGWAPPDEVIGQRGQTIDPEREQILAIGDSILYGHGVSDTETAPFHLESMLPGYQVLNLSVSGYSIDQYYIYLKRILPRVTAKLVIVGLFTGNDYEVTGLEFGWGHTKPLYRWREGALALHRADLLADNCIDHMAQSLLFRALWLKKEIALDLIELFCEPVKLGPEELEQVISGLFAGIDDAAAAGGAEVLYVLLPRQGHIPELENDWTRYANKYNRLRQILIAGGHRYYEPYPDLVRAGGENETGIFLDGAHFTPYGNQVLAAALAGVIRRDSLLSGRVARPEKPEPKP